MFWLISCPPAFNLNLKIVSLFLKKELEIPPFGFTSPFYCDPLQARTTEASLQLLRRNARQRGAGGIAGADNDNISDNLSEKICAQLFLDVQVFVTFPHC